MLRDSGSAPCSSRKRAASTRRFEQATCSNDSLGCTSNAQRDFEVLVKRRMGDDGEPLPGQRSDERRVQGGIVSVVDNAQVAAGKLAARELFVCRPRVPVADCAGPE